MIHSQHRGRLPDGGRAGSVKIEHPSPYPIRSIIVDLEATGLVFLEYRTVGKLAIIFPQQYQQKTPHRSPDRARYGVYSVDPASA